MLLILSEENMIDDIEDYGYKNLIKKIKISIRCIQCNKWMLNIPYTIKGDKFFTLNSWTIYKDIKIGCKHCKRKIEIRVMYGILSNVYKIESEKDEYWEYELRKRTQTMTVYNKNQLLAAFECAKGHFGETHITLKGNGFETFYCLGGRGVSTYFSRFNERELYYPNFEKYVDRARKKIRGTKADAFK